MKKVIIGFATIVIIGVAYWFISPFFIDRKVSEEAPVVSESAVMLGGTFSGFDRVHYGSGSTKLIKSTSGYLVRFEEDFKVANGPDLYVGFGKDGEYVKGSEISRLKGNIGSQNYEVPEGMNLADYNEIWIWCRAFSVGFAKASLKPL